MLAVASLKRSLEFDPVEQGVKRKRAEIKLPATTFTVNNTSVSPSKQQSIFTKSSSSKNPLSKSCSVTALTSSTDDIPMFNHNQTAQICARLLREQDKLLREQYEKLLSTKLNEQYEQFVRYSHDSIHKKPPQQQFYNFGQQQETENVPMTAFSYVS